MADRTPEELAADALHNCKVGIEWMRDNIWIPSRGQALMQRLLNDIGIAQASRAASGAADRQPEPAAQQRAGE